uniref:Uncharacterized protein n=1 Tax=Arundo donax TaxID=35708 RepID=A0A0A9GZQ9_ARUDO
MVASAAVSKGLFALFLFFHFAQSLVVYHNEDGSTPYLLPLSELKLRSLYDLAIYK